VDQDVQAGLKIAAKDEQAGKDAMVERNQRRIGLGMCLVAIGLCWLGFGCSSGRSRARYSAARWRL